MLEPGGEKTKSRFAMDCPPPENYFSYVQRALNSGENAFELKFADLLDDD